MSKAICLLLLAAALPSYGQWFPPAVSFFQGFNDQSTAILSNTNGISYGQPAPLGSSISYQGADNFGDVWSLSIGWDGSNFAVSFNDQNNGYSGSGTFTPSSNAFSLGGSYTATAVNSDGSQWPPATEGGPPAVQVNSSIWQHIGNSGGTDVYGDEAGDLLSVSSSGSSYTMTAGQYAGWSGWYSNGTFLSPNSSLDLRSVDLNNNLLVPSYGPTYGPPAVLIAGNHWQFAGTGSSSSGTVDLYLGSQVGQMLWVGSNGYSLTDPQDSGYTSSGTYDGLFYSGQALDMRPANVDGSVGSPATGYSALWITENGMSASQWSFYADINGSDYFLGGSPGQMLAIIGGSVYLTDPSASINTSGSYSASTGNFSVSGASVQASVPQYPHSSSAFGYNPVWVSGVEYDWQSGYTDALGNSYDFYSSATGATITCANGSFGGVDVGTTPPHGSSAFGYSQIWLNGVEYDWQSGYTDGYGNSYDFYSSANNATIAYSNGSFGGLDVCTTPPHSSSAFEYSQIWVNNVLYNWQYGYTDPSNNSVDVYADAHGDTISYTNGSFPSGVNIQTTAPPSSPLYGPASLWVNGTNYAWSSSSVNPDTTGTDNYTDGAGHWASIAYNPSNTPVYYVSINTPDGKSWYGAYDNTTLLFNVSGLDVRAADANGNVLYATAPWYLPPAIRVDAPSPLWQYMGSDGWTVGSLTSPVYYYGGGQGGQILIIDANGIVSLNDPVGGSTNGIYADGAFWTDQRDVRPMNTSGQPLAPAGHPVLGPPAVTVNGTWWSYLGSWPVSGSYPFSNTPTVGDYYAGANAGQRLWIDWSGNVTLVLASGSAATGTYAAGVFTVTGNQVAPMDANGNPLSPTFGPPSVWVDGVLFSFQTTNSATDTYGDSMNNTVTISGTAVAGYDSQQNLIWSGTYTASSGLFAVTSLSDTGAWYDVRSYNGTSPLNTQASQQTGHPAEVKVNGSCVFWTFAGQTTANATIYDYYFGPSTGQRLIIDSAGDVEVWTSAASEAPAATGFFSGTVGGVFVMSAADLRAFNADNTPDLPPSGSTPLWGPPNVWVNGLTWVWLGEVADSTRGVYADYYGGPNSGEVLSVDSSSNVVLTSGGTTSSGVYGGGVFVVGNNDVRGLAANGQFTAVTSTPLYGDPGNLRAGGLQWSYLGNTGGVNYYAAPLSGERLSLDQYGSVTYTTDVPHYVASATGTFNPSTGLFTSVSGGTSYNAGTVTGDLDILGNILSLGSLVNNPDAAGVAIQYTDNLNAPSGPPASTLDFTASRATANWMWSHTNSSSPDEPATPMMWLDAQNRLNLYDPTVASQVGVVLDPHGRSSFNGAVRITAQGDLTMGAFTQEPQQ